MNGGHGEKCMDREDGDRYREAQRRLSNERIYEGGDDCDDSKKGDDFHDTRLTPPYLTETRTRGITLPQ